MADSRSLQEEEYEVLQSIYGDDCSVFSEEHFCEVRLRMPRTQVRGDINAGEEDRTTLVVRMHVPETYPSQSAPIAELQAHWLKAETLERILKGLEELHVAARGEVIMFAWVEWIKEQDWIWYDARKSIVEVGCEISKVEEGGNGQKAQGCVILDMAELSISEQEEEESMESADESRRTRYGDGAGEVSGDLSVEEWDSLLGIVHGQPFTIKKSTFQGHLAPVRSVADVVSVMEALTSNRKIADATHNIMAYRIMVPEKKGLLQDCDDDGENAAGGRLLHLLQIVEAVNVVVVVSRWFGGILLGPDRFKHINNAARSVLDECGFIATKGSASTGSRSKSAREQNHRNTSSSSSSSSCAAHGPVTNTKGTRR